MKLWDFSLDSKKFFFSSFCSVSFDSGLWYSSLADGTRSWHVFAVNLREDASVKNCAILQICVLPIALKIGVGFIKRS